MVTPGPPFAGSDLNQIWPFSVSSNGQNNWFSSLYCHWGKTTRHRPSHAIARAGWFRGPYARSVGAGPTPAHGTAGGEPLAVFSCCVGPVCAHQNPICCSITEYVANNTPRWANVRVPLLPSEGRRRNCWIREGGVSPQGSEEACGHGGKEVAQ
jgi:hypothetical protein